MSIVASTRLLALAVLAVLLAQLFSLPQAVAQAPQPAAPSGAAKSAQPLAKPTQASQPAPAPQTPSPSALPPQVGAALSNATATLSEVEKALQHLSTVEGELSDLRAKVEQALDNTAEATAALRPQLAAVKSQIETVGPAPGKDAPAEAPEMAAERARLSTLAAAYDGAIKASELTEVRARQLIERITGLRHSLFTKNLMERLPSLLTPGAWRDAAAAAAIARLKLTADAEQWWQMARPRQVALLALLGAAGGVLLILKLALWRATRRRSLRAEPPLPTFFERAVSAFWVAALSLLPVLVAALVLYIGLDALDLTDGNRLGELLPALLRGVLVFAAMSALVGAVLAPGEAQWRLVDLADQPAARLTRLVSAMAAVYALDGVLTEVFRALYIPLALSVAQSIAASLAFAALLIGVLITPLAPQQTAPAAADAVSRHAPRLLKLPLWIVAIGIIIAAVLGYAALARFASQQLLLTGIVLLLCWLGYLAIRAFTREPTQQSRVLSSTLEHRLGLDRPRRQQLATLTEVALTFTLLICAIPFLMLQWGFSGADIRDWSKSLLFGIEVGQFRFSLVRILAGIVLFIALLLATRLIQRWMRERAAQSRIDPGIANSIETVLGYAGTWLAALVALSYAGLDVTSLALVAGALSVGIGFGLQSIVNNFVSGLILLIERPIKVGDRVVIGDQQGHVRRISVRATEVETFDRASVIVPNSELITGRVVNWSHRDWRGAVSVKVGVAYDADPDLVIGILKKCASEHPLVLPDPPPGVSLDNFGDSALQFSVRVSLPDIDKAGEVQSDLRVAILKAFRAAGIEIPFNHLDVTLRDVEAMRRYLDEVLERPVEKSEAAKSDVGKQKSQV